MGLFNEFNQNASIYNPINNVGTDTITYSMTADSIIPLHIIRVSNNEIYVFGDEIADHVCSPNSDLTASIKKNAKIVQGSATYKVVNEPEYRKLSKVTSIELKRLENV